MSRREEIDEGLIHAWLDGELTGEEAARIARLAATDAAWSAAVAEARGLIAASSRIVKSLDAVPDGVIPKGSKAAPARGVRVRPWMRMAAGLLLVAGTAYTVRELITPQPPIAAVDVATPPPSTAPTSTTAAPTPPVAEVARENRVAAPPPTPSVSGGSGAPANAPVIGEAAAPTSAPTVAPSQPARAMPAPTAPVPMPTFSREQLDAQKASADRAAAERVTAESDRVVSTMRRARQEPAPSAAPRTQLAEPSRDFAAGAASAGPLAALEGCWRATAPDSLAALYRDLAILRQFGDTLVLVLPNANTVRVVRRDDTLRGALTATRVSCPPESSTTPPDWW